MKSGKTDADQGADRFAEGLTGSSSLVLCAANAYEQKYYLNEKFSRLPPLIKEDLKIMCVACAEEIGAVFILEFDKSGNLLLETVSKPDDFMYDEIGAELCIRSLRTKKRELFESLEMYCKVFMLKTDPETFLKGRENA